jgi:methylglutaconyl-CoA hydratase
MSTLIIRNEPSVRLITLNRPDVRNALSQELRQELFEAFLETRNDPTIRAVILTGASTAFCAGMDLAELEQLQYKSYEENLEDATQFGKLLELIYTFPKPVIAALNGHAIAGGAGLASVCDFVVMSETAKFGYTESRLGFVAALVSVFLVRQVGERRARDLLLSARLLEAKEALGFGLINEIQPADKVMTRGLELAHELIQNAPNALAITKHLLADLPSLSLQDSLRHAAKVNAKVRGGDELSEGIRAFLEKRQARW